MRSTAIHDVKWQATKPLYAVASQAKRAKEVILKVVNVSRTDQETDLRLEGARIGPTATAIVLASDKPEDENTLDQPAKVSPVTLTLDHAALLSVIPSRQLRDRAAPEARVRQRRLKCGCLVGWLTQRK